MSRKFIPQLILLVIILLATFAQPGSAQAWSGCGSTYVVQWGDTLSGIAARCGTTVAALYAANPGISGYLYAGQVLYMPGGDYCNCPQNGYTDTYTVQRGDTFSEIAKRFGVSINQLWAANPSIWDINRIYPGQVINVPAYAPAMCRHPVHPGSDRPATTSPWSRVRMAACLPKTQTGNVKLINIANAEVYVSLQGTTSDGARVINEYPVEGTMKVNVPAGWYIYVAWVGGEKFSGQFKLGGDSSHTLMFYPNKVVYSMNKI